MTRRRRPSPHSAGAVASGHRQPRFESPPLPIDPFRAQRRNSAASRLRLVGCNSLFGSPAVANALEQWRHGHEGALDTEAEPARLGRRARRVARAGRWVPARLAPRSAGAFCDEGGAAAADSGTQWSCRIPAAHGSDDGRGARGRSTHGLWATAEALAHVSRADAVLVPALLLVPPARTWARRRSSG